MLLHFPSVVLTLLAPPAFPSPLVPLSRRRATPRPVLCGSGDGSESADEGPIRSQRDVIERVMDDRQEEGTDEEGTVAPTPASRRRLAMLTRRAEEEAAEMAASGSPFLGPLSFGSFVWPTGDPRANPSVGGRRGLRSVQWGRGISDDASRRLACYASDWRDGLTPKSCAAITFLWFACLAPVLAFGGAMSVLTDGAMGVPEVILSRGVCGMAHAAAAGQPMTFLGPTGLTLAFTTALYAYCSALSLPFLPMYAWVGMWTSGMLLAASVANLSGLIRYCTRFTEDVFNFLLAFNYVAEACRSIRASFTGLAGSGFLALNTAGLTALGRLCGLGRPLLVDLFALAPRWRLLAALPAVFLALLFFLDQNITVRTVNAPANKLRKGAAYHLDLLVLALLTGATSLCGLPWMCSATVESLNHARLILYRARIIRCGERL
ncbi:HCO3--transporter [Emiliania huxleyi CCMP1516]|uniref:Bicarbonate transporter-like transmembrane domain-containing protein n=2 Tax=Emiliania huxleyi TaxID=2903 RepID=A0A0D3J4N4_EMIH1|nr:HCO3--transporter [Emiliania huxleyi CCMP1516]EOD18469.1 HCO3--transporter [Emiliania huxleyi CCMP1516]|eukprot:XP_005770898.1 HCO3--transporter [Emiliania huxleyi CCMP1516]